MWQGRLPMKDAPDWYNTPLDQLDFEWSTEEKLEIDRWCEKILKNIEEEGGMTPRERWWACMRGEDKDRMLITQSGLNVYATRTLDSWADALKPIDVYSWPKLWVKAHLACFARFKMDYPSLHTINYSEDMFGGQSKMTEYSNPVLIGNPPIKNMEDLEGIEMPDPRKHGLFPGYLWANRELRRIIDEYKLPIPIWTSLGPDPAMMAMMGMVGWAQFHILLRKKPELIRKCVDITTEWIIRIGKALIEECSPEGIYLCILTGGFKLTGNEWIADQYAKIGKTLHAYQGKDTHMSHGYSYLGGCSEWYPILWEHGSFALDAFDGGCGGRGETDLEWGADWHHEHGLHCGYSITDHTLQYGPISAIEEEMKELVLRNKHMPKFTANVCPPYWVPAEHVDAAMEAGKKYGRYE